MDILLAFSTSLKGKQFPAHAQNAVLCYLRYWWHGLYHHLLASNAYCCLYVQRYLVKWRAHGLSVLNGGGIYAYRYVHVSVYNVSASAHPIEIISSSSSYLITDSPGHVKIRHCSIWIRHVTSGVSDDYVCVWWGGGGGDALIFLMQLKIQVKNF